MRDTIHIQGLAVPVSIGVSEEERSRKQNLLIDVEMEPQYSFDSLQENIFLTADYEKAAQRIRSHCATVSYKLLETLATEIVALLLKEFPIKQASIRIRKFVLSDTEFVAVQTTQKRSH